MRIKKNDRDGSYVVFKRTTDDRKLFKISKDKKDRIKMKAAYYRNPKGYLSTGRIFDAQGTLIYRVRYGYDKETGLLIAEDMFDARARYYYPPSVRDKKGKRVEMPIRRVYYFYDADGNQSKAISLVPKKGKFAADVFKKSRDTMDLYSKEKSFDTSTSTNPLHDNPFEQEKKEKRRRTPR